MGLVVCGESGDGILRAGRWLSLVFARLGSAILGEAVPPPEFEGASASFRLRLSKIQPRTTLAPHDLIVAMDTGAFRGVREFARRGAFCLIDGDGGALAADDARLQEVARAPIRRVARLSSAGADAEALALCGVVAGLLQISYADLLWAIAPALSSGAELNTNIPRVRMDEALRKQDGESMRKCIEAALRAGHEIGFEQFKGRVAKVLDGFKRSESAAESQASEPAPNRAAVTSLPEEIARGLSRAGVRFVTGVPDAACGQLLTAIARELSRPGDSPTGAVRLVETAELALSVASGASAGGSCVATVMSSEGFMQSFAALATASHAEVPGVIVVVETTHPLGGPLTPAGQNLLLAAIHGAGASGLAPAAGPAVLSLAHPKDAAQLAFEATRLAEEYQIPVVLLLEARFLHFVLAADTTDALESAPNPTRALWRDTFDQGDRYEPTPGGISRMSIPGTGGPAFTLTPLDHDAAGVPAPLGRAREIQGQKRARKMELLRAEMERSPLFCGVDLATEVEDFDLIALSMGGPCGAIADATATLLREGIRMLPVSLTGLEPIPRRFLTRVRERFDDRAVLVFEENGTGPLALHLRAEFGLRGASIRRGDGNSMRPQEILQKVREVFARR